MDEISRAKSEAWDECIRELFIYTARGKVFSDEGWVNEFPPNPYCEGNEVWGREEHATALQAMHAVVWREGFNAGHYLEGEVQECDCAVNPYEGEK